MRNNTKYNESSTAIKPEVVKAAVTKLGITPWTVPSSGETRYYLNSDELEKIGAIIVFRYKSGNVKHFAIWDTVENKFRKSANRRAYTDSFNTFIDDSGFVYTDYELEGGFLTAIVDCLNRFVAEDLAKEKEDEEAPVADDASTEQAEDKSNEVEKDTIVADVLADVPVTKKAAVDAVLAVVAAAGWQSQPTRKAMQTSLEERGFSGTVGSLRAALEDMITNTVSVNVTLPANAEAETADETPVETESEPVEAPTVPALGVAAAEIPTPVAVVKLDEEQADAADEAQVESDADADKTADAPADEPAEKAPAEKPAEEVADALIWRAEVPRMKALKLLACAFTGKDAIENGELLDLLKDGKTPMPDFKERLSDAETVDLATLHGMLIESARMGADIRKFRWIGGQA